MKACALVLLSVLFNIVVVKGQLSDFSGTDFTKADSIAELYPMHPLKDLKVLSDKLTAPLSTDVEKFRSIFKWVCTNIENDYALFLENKNMRAKLKGERLTRWEKNFSTRVFGIMASRHRTICTGYAYLVKELAFHAGMNCRIVNGYGRHARANIGGSGIVNHSWNAIELQGKWYVCDPTWSSGMIDAQNQAYTKKFEDVYFLSEPSLFVRSHFPLDPEWILLNEKPALETFLNAPLVYMASFRFAVEPVAPALFNIDVPRDGHVSFEFTMGSAMTFRDASLYIEDSRAGDSFERHSGDVVTYGAVHKFSRKGTYAVHIVVDGSPVLSYNVRVQ